MARLICLTRGVRSATFSQVLLQRKTLPFRSFSSTIRAMTATKIDGTAIAKSIRERIAGEIKKQQDSNPRYRPSLTIVQGKMAAVPHDELG